MADDKPKRLKRQKPELYKRLNPVYSEGPPNNRKSATVVKRVDIKDDDKQAKEKLDNVRQRTREVAQILREEKESAKRDFTDLTVNVFDYLKELRDELNVEKFGPAGIKWMRDTIQQLHTMEDLSVEEKFVRDEKRIRARTSFKRIGWMYMFNYQPLHKDKEKYYDTFPLIYILRLDSDGFVGINLHYLPPIMRERVFLMLQRFASGSYENEETRLVLRYEYMMKQPIFRHMLKPCIRKYLYRRMDSFILHIPAEDWYIASFLPLSRFKKAHRALVWKDTRDKIRQSRLYREDTKGYLE